MTTINLDLTAHRTRSDAERQAFAAAFEREVVPLMNDSPSGVVLRAIGDAIVSASADSNAIDVSVLTAATRAPNGSRWTSADQLADTSRVAIALQEVNGTYEQPPGFLLAFVASMKSAFPGLAAVMKASGKLDQR